MNGYNIESVNGLGIETTAGSILLFATATPPYPLDFPSTSVITFADNIFGIATNSHLLIAGTDTIYMSTGIVINSSNSISSLAAYNEIHQTPDFIVSTCKNSYYIQNIRQPFIQYGEVATSGSNSNVEILLQIPYSSILGYQAFGTMHDTTPAEISIMKSSPSSFTIFWDNASGGSHAIAWNTMGNVEECLAVGEPAYNLVNYITGDTMYASWSDDSTPDSYTVYVEQSSDDSSWSVYTTQDVYSNSADFYTLTQNYYYRFYVSSHYSGTRVDSSNSASQYVTGI